LIDINIDNASSRTKKIDMTPIRLEGDDDDEGDGDDGDEDEDEDEESTPVPRSKRHVARCVFLYFHSVSEEIFMFTYHDALIRKTATAKPAPVKTKSRKRDMGRERDDGEGSSDSGASGPADSIMDSSSEEEADDEVDGMLGE
jgi:hypothetical protein